MGVSSARIKVRQSVGRCNCAIRVPQAHVCNSDAPDGWVPGHPISATSYKIWGLLPGLLQTCALPRCPSTTQSPSPESSSSASTEPPISSTTRSGTLQVFPRSGHADLREHQNTNVVKFHSLLDKNCPLEQIVYYQVRVAFDFISIELSIISQTCLIRFAAWYWNLHQLGSI